MKDIHLLRGKRTDNKERVYGRLVCRACGYTTPQTTRPCSNAIRRQVRNPASLSVFEQVHTTLHRFHFPTYRSI